MGSDQIPNKTSRKNESKRRRHQDITNNTSIDIVFDPWRSIYTGLANVHRRQIYGD